MNHAGEITPLSALIRPHVAVITRIAAAHVGYFNSVADIARAKAEIFSGLEPDGAAVVPTDTPHCALLLDAARQSAAEVITFGTGAAADVILREVRQQADNNQVSAEISGTQVEFTTGSPGRHTAMNALAVLAVIKILGLDIQQAADRFAEITALPGRGRQQQIPVVGGSILLIDESYNANAASVTAALDVLQQQAPDRTGQTQGRRIAVLGDMLELGDAGPAEHTGLATAVAEAKVDRLFTCGPLMGLLFAAVQPSCRALHCQSAPELVAPLLAEISAGDVVLVKGSLSMGMAPIVKALQGLAVAETPRQRSNAHAV